METNDFSRITTLSQLRQTRKDVSEQIHILESRISHRLDGFKAACSFKGILLPILRKLRKTISGTPFAKY